MGSWNDFIKKTKERFKDEKNVYSIIIWSDAFKVMTFSEFLDKVTTDDKVLDVRVFNDVRELRIFRDYKDNKFNNIVEISDKENDDTENGAVFDRNKKRCFSYDDEQFIDYDVKRSHTEGMRKATGGGEYAFPIEIKEKTKLIIRNYVDYDEQGQAYIKAWRVVGFKN